MATVHEYLSGGGGMTVALHVDDPLDMPADAAEHGYVVEGAHGAAWDVLAVGDAREIEVGVEHEERDGDDVLRTIRPAKMELIDVTLGIRMIDNPAIVALLASRPGADLGHLDARVPVTRRVPQLGEALRIVAPNDGASNEKAQD